MGMPTEHRLLVNPFVAALFMILGFALFQGCDSGNHSGSLSRQTEQQARTDEATDPPEVAAGERLFLETRFAQFFKNFLDQGGKVNDALPAGDPVMAVSMTTGQPLPGPFAGKSMNCRTCHLVDEQLQTAEGGMRTYADFARRSPIPARADGKATAPRNSPPLVNASLPRPGGILLHFDAEFPSLVDLITATFTGRNFGWLPGEQQIAVAHLAKIIREDDGKGELAGSFGGLSYATLLAGTDPSIPKQFQLPDAFRIKVATAADQEIFLAVAKLVAAYTEQLVFSQDDQGNFNLSPFDVFLQINGLPRKPDPNETDLDYSRRLLQAVKAREQAGLLQFVTANPQTPDGKFKFHTQEFRFGPDELLGLKIFFAEPVSTPIPPNVLAQGQIGNCLACHAAPTFTDFKLHNTGTAQVEYDGIHGAGAFAQLFIPALTDRNAAPDKYLPATGQHPNAKEPFRAIPIVGDPALTDLGVWNIFANPDFPLPQDRIKAILCEGLPPGCAPDDTLLTRAIARFKTPGLRDLGHSAPYMHTGQFDTLDSIVDFYRGVSNLARTGTLRNGAAELKKIALTPNGTASLVAFLKSLNEDYE